jgi:hypothetical protein
MRALLALGALGVIAAGEGLCPASVLAQESAVAGGRVRLAWSAPGGCPSEEAVLTEMQRILGGPPSRDAEAKANVERVAPRRWSEHLTTQVDGVAGERALDADSCEGLASATALILAWTIDPERARVASRSTPGVPIEPPPPPTTPLAAPAPPPPSPELPLAAAPRAAPAARAPTTDRAGVAMQAEDRARPRGVAAVEAQADVGTLPSAGFAGRFVLGALFGRARLEASFADWLQNEATASPPKNSEGATLHPLEGALRGCFRWEPSRRLEVDPCLGAGLTHVTSDGFGETGKIFRGPTGQATTWGNFYADVVGAFALIGPLALRASLGVSVPFARPEFDIDEPPGQAAIPLHRASPAAGRATLGVEARFP